MTFRNFVMITAFISWAFGVGFLADPELMSNLYGVPFSPSVAMLDRFFGSALFGIGLFCWALRDVTDVTLIQKILVAHAVHDVVGCVVAIHSTATGTLNFMGWGVVFIYGALAVGSSLLFRADSAAHLKTIGGR